MKPESHRLPRLDALRALWMLWMAGFHCCFDLANQRLIDTNFYADPLWTTQRTLILGGFLCWAGLGQGLNDSPRFWRRWLQIAGAAALVTLGSWWMFPHSFISFGVLHAFLLLLPLARALRRAPSGAVLGLAAAALLLPVFIQHEFFDSRWTYWVGLVTRKPITEDFVPLLPWAAPLLLGLLAARSDALRAWLAGAAPRPLIRLGLWPLSFYLLHQPVLLGLLWLWQRSITP